VVESSEMTFLCGTVNPVIPDTVHSNKATFITKTIVLQRFAACFGQLSVNITLSYFVYFVTTSPNDDRIGLIAANLISVL